MTARDERPVSSVPRAAIALLAGALILTAAFFLVSNTLFESDGDVGESADGEAVMESDGVMDETEAQDS